MLPEAPQSCPQCRLRAGLTEPEWTVFEAGGHTALAQWKEGPPWVQISIHLASFPTDHLYSRIAEATRRLLNSGLADKSFFVHKPPGIRWRLRVAPHHCSSAEQSSTAANNLEEEARTLLKPDISIRSLERTWYEPQQSLFGGPASMESVHDLWTSDSLMWLDWHSSGKPQTVLSVSLSALALIFAGIGIKGWEDREVWDCISHESGRKLAVAEWNRAEVRDLAEQIRQQWNDVWRSVQTGGLPPSTQKESLLKRFNLSTTETLRNWDNGFRSGQYAVGARRAAARWTVFHWNRSRLNMGFQSAICESLNRDFD